MSQVQQVASGVGRAFEVLSKIARRNGHTISSVTVNVAETNLETGPLSGSVTVKNRSRRAFKIEPCSGGVNVTLMGVTEKIAA